MLNLKKEKAKNTLRLIPHTGACGEVRLAQTNQKIIIGRSEHCHVKIESDFISATHALCFLDEFGEGQIIDLGSLNGTYVNGQRVSKAPFRAGDYIRLANIDFFVEEMAPVVPAVKTPDLPENTAEFSLKDIGFIAPNVSDDAPPLPGWEIIDGELCHIRFDEAKFEPVFTHPLDMSIEDEEGLHQEMDSRAIPVVRPTRDRAIEVTIMSNDAVLETSYIPMRDGTFYFSGKKRHRNCIILELLEKHEKVPFLRLRKGKAELLPVRNFTAINLQSPHEDYFHGREAVVLEDRDLIRLHFKTVQIFIRTVEAPPKLRVAPLLDRDKALYKYASSATGIGIVIMLLLLLVDITKEETKEEQVVAVIYEKPVESTVEDAASVKMDNPENLSNEKVETKQEAPKKVAEKTPPKTVERPQPPKEAPQVQAKNVETPKQKIKTYEVPNGAKLNKLFAQIGDFDTTPTKNTDLGTTKEAIKVSGQMAMSGPKRADVGETSALSGSGKAGVAALGAKGDFDKKGIVTASVKTRTVVLGSIDPEVIRKLLEEHIPQFRHCYQQELAKKSEDVEGVVDLVFTIGTEGKVTVANVQTKKSGFSKAGTQCMANVLKIIQFPKPKGGGVVEVRQPLNFSAEKN